MKRLLSVLLVLMMMPVSLTANANVDNALYPIRENGLWGYINRAGEVVIEPKWARAWLFDGNTALVSTEEIPAYAEPHGNGIIGRDGNMS